VNYKINSGKCMTLKSVKGIVHLKMNILPSFTHPQVVSNQLNTLIKKMEKIRSSVDYSICHETILDCYIF